MKSEAYRRLTFEKRLVVFIDKNILAEAGFYYTDHSEVVCCASCVAQIGLWQGDDVFKVYRRWSPNGQFIRSLSVGNIPIGSPTSIPQRLRSLPEALTCVILILSIDPIHIQNDVRVLACFSSSSKCAAFIAHH